MRVTIRCNNAREAAEVLKAAVARQQGSAKSHDVILDVPIRAYRRDPPDPLNRDEWEIGVDW